jgi:hypothetical protein
LRRVSLVLMVPLAALFALSQTSCGGKEGQRIFIKLYTSCNMQGTLEPCG